MGIVALVVCAGLLALAAATFAQDERPSTFGMAAAETDFPVFKPHRTLGLKARVITMANRCVPDAGKRMVIANYGRPGGGGPQIGIWQAKPFICGDPGSLVRTGRSASAIAGSRCGSRANRRSPSAS